MTIFRFMKAASVLFSVVLTLTASSAFSAQRDAMDVQSWVPSAQLIAEVEAHITIPQGRGGGALPTYSRYYYGKFAHSHRILVGDFILDDTENHVGVHIGPAHEASHIADGGCGVIEIIYDVEAKKLLSLTCNGVA